MRLDQPLWLLLLLPVLAAVTVWARSGRAPHTLAWILAPAALLAFGAAGLFLKGATPSRRHVLVVDRSGSVRPFLDGADLERLVADHGAKFDPADRLGLVFFGREAIVVAPPVQPAQFRASNLEGFVVPSDGTDLGRALALASSLLPREGGGEILLVSDGRDTAGAGAAGALEAAARGVRVHAAPAGRAPGGDFGIEALEGPSRVPPGTSVVLAARVVSWSGGEAWVRFRDGEGQLIGAPRRAAFLPGERRLVLSEPFVPRGGDEPRFAAQVSPVVGRDPFPLNDAAETVVRVSGALRALYLSEDPLGRLFGKLLERVPGFEVEKLKPFRLGPRPDLDAYDLVVLDGVPSASLGEARMRALEAFVSDGGGGLVLLGGPEGFGPGGYFDSPVERVSPVRCDPEEKASLALVLLLDSSGSMNALVGADFTKFHAARVAVEKLLQKLRRGDYVAVVPFSGAPLLDPGLAGTVEEGAPSGILARLLAVRCAGPTAILSALEAARDILAHRTEPRRHVLLLSDGVETARADMGRYGALGAAFEGNRITVSAAVTATQLTPTVRRFVEGRIVHRGKVYAVEEFARLARDFVEDVTRARGELTVRGPFEALPGRAPDGLPAAGAPPVISVVRSGLKRETAAAALSAGSDDTPLVAWGRSGLGRTVAFTSSLEGDWAPAWRSWGGRDARDLLRFWERWLHWAAREGGQEAVTLRREGGAVVVRVRGRGGASLEDGLRLRARLLTEGRAAGEQDLVQEGVGAYGAAFPSPAPGLVRALVLDEEGRTLGEGALWVGSSAETGALGPDEEGLRALLGGGGILWDAPEAFVPGPAPVRAGPGREGGWVLSLAAAFVFVAGLLTRRRRAMAGRA